MKNKIYMILISAFIVSGCNSDDVQDFIDKQRDNFKGITDERGHITEGIEENIPVSGQEQDALDIHNNTRNAVGVTNDLVWSDVLAKAAQSYADEAANSGAWEHDPNNQKNGYGENLYTSTEKVTLEEATDAWANEKQYYHYDDNSCDENQMCGHYTQIVWESTSQVGCAISKYKTGEYKNWYLIVCKYKTPGNYRGQKPY